MEEIQPWQALVEAGASLEKQYCLVNDYWQRSSCWKPGGCGHRQINMYVYRGFKDFIFAFSASALSVNDYNRILDLIKEAAFWYLEAIHDNHQDWGITKQIIYWQLLAVFDRQKISTLERFATMPFEINPVRHIYKQRGVKLPQLPCNDVQITHEFVKID